MTLLAVDPNLVQPGWTPLLVIVLLGVVLFLLGRSMLKQFGKIDVPADHPSSTDQTTEAGPERVTPQESGTPRSPGDAAT